MDPSVTLYMPLKSYVHFPYSLVLKTQESKEDLEVGEEVESGYIIQACYYGTAPLFPK